MTGRTRAWQAVPASDIEPTLAGKTIHYDDGNWQTFAADGTTRYVDRGHDTYGGWRLAGARRQFRIGLAAVRALGWLSRGSEPRWSQGAFHIAARFYLRRSVRYRASRLIRTGS